jgi:hypothetical protein
MPGWWFDRSRNLFDKMPCDIPGSGCPCVDGANPSFFVELFKYSRQYKQVEEHAPGRRNGELASQGAVPF